MTDNRIPNTAHPDAYGVGKPYGFARCEHCGLDVEVTTDGRGSLVEYVGGRRHRCPPPSMDQGRINQPTAIAIRIVRARERMGINQLDCAMRAGIGHTRMGQIERGAREPTMEEIRALEWVLGGLTTTEGR